MDSTGHEKDRSKRQKLYEAGEPLLVAYGYRKTTVEEICRAAGMSKRTFYELFRDKAEFCVRLVVHLAGELVTSWRERVAADLTSRRKLALFLEQYLVVCRRHQVFRVLFEEPELIQAFGRLCELFDHSQLYLTLHEILVEGMERGEFERYEPGRMVMLIYGLLDTMAYMAPQCYATTSILEDEAAASEVVTFILNGITRCGRDAVPDTEPSEGRPTS